MDEFQGAITGIVDGHVVGWAWRPATPHAKVSLEIWLGAHRLGQCDAALFDADLQTKGIGDGHHAFRFRPTSVPEVDFPATIFGCIADSDHYLGGSLLISSAQDLLKRFAVQRRAEIAPVADETVAPVAQPQIPRPVDVAPPSPPAAGPLATPTMPTPGQAIAGMDILTSQLTRLRDMVGQSLIERVEAQLTILRDEFDREMQLVRRDLAALAARMPAADGRLEQAPSPSPAAPTLEYAAPTPEYIKTAAATIATPSEAKLPATQTPVPQDRNRDAPPALSDKPEPAKESAAPPLKYQRFAPVTAQRPGVPPLPGRGPRRQR